jgi:hypothetical protein
MNSPSDYIPHGLVVAFATVVSWVYRDHVKRDDSRFDALKADYDKLDAKLDAQNVTIASNHSEILNLLLHRKDS